MDEHQWVLGDMIPVQCQDPDERYQGGEVVGVGACPGLQVYGFDQDEGCCSNVTVSMETMTVAQ